jgi:hypothetical protein
MNIYSITLLYYILYPLSKIIHFRIPAKFLRIIESLYFVIGCLIYLYLPKFETINWLIFGILIWIIYLPIMIAMNSGSINHFLRFKYGLIKYCKYLILNKNKSLNCILAVIKEELIWRYEYVYFMQMLEFNKGLIIFVGSVLFYAIHWGKKGKIILLSEIEFLIFSVLLYIVYFYSNSMILLITIHFMRNSYLDFIKYRNEKWISY